MVSKRPPVSKEILSASYPDNDRLGIAFYDKELLAEAAKESGISEQLFENVDEQAVNSILYSLALGAYASANKLTPLSDISMNDRLFQLQSGNYPADR